MVGSAIAPGELHSPELLDEASFKNAGGTASRVFIARWLTNNSYTWNSTPPLKVSIP